MNKSTTILLAVLVLLAAGAYFFLNKGETTNKSWELAYENVDNIHQIGISHPNGTNLKLSRDGKNWLIGNRPARKEAVDLLLETLKKLHIRARVPLTAEDNIRRQFKKQGITVKAYNRSGKEIRTWIVGSESKGGFGTYMTVKGADHPYDVDILGWEGALRPRFHLTEKAWRDRTVFHYDTDEIKSVEVRYFNEKIEKSSFKVERGSGKEFIVSPLVGREKSLEKPVKGKVLFYLKGFESIVAEDFVNKLQDRESLVKSTPHATISLETMDGETKQVELYPTAPPVQKLEKGGMTSSEEIERYYGSVDGNVDLVLLQNIVMGKLLTDYTYFYKQD